MGSAGVAGPIGPAGPTGADGHEGFTPTLLSDSFAGTLTYASGAAAVEVMRQTVRAPGDSGALLVRVYFNGTVSKRQDATSCTVEVSLWQDNQPVSLAAQNVGVFQAAPPPMVLGVSGTLAHQIIVRGAELIELRVEARRIDEDCAPPMATGATPIAQVLSRMEIQFFRFSLLDR